MTNEIDTNAPDGATLRIANATREVVNEALARYDVPPEVYEQDVLIDAACVCAADKMLRDAESGRQEAMAALVEARDLILGANHGPTRYPRAFVLLTGEVQVQDD